MKLPALWLLVLTFLWPLENLGKKRILLSDDQRRRLAAKGNVLGRKRLGEFGTLFTPDTILRWHRMLIAKKWDYSDRRNSVGRPRVKQEIVDLVLQFARENPSWGYDRIQGALANLGHEISDQTVGNVLKRHGIEPVSDRKRQTTWATFLKAHWDVLAAIDFTTIEVWTKGGLDHFLPVAGHGTKDTPSTLRWLHHQSERIVDEASRS